MTLEDLQQHGVLLPENEWGEHSLETTTRQWGLAVAFLTAAAALIAALLGDGGLLTWIGIGAFLVMFFAITWMCDRAVLRLRQRIQREQSGAED